MSKYGSTAGQKVIFYVILILVFLLFLIGKGIFAIATNEDVAVRALEAQGYSNIQIVDRAWFEVGFRGCGFGDSVRFTAKVTNPAGKPAEVYVCTGVIFKGGTIRVR